MINKRRNKAAINLTQSLPNYLRYLEEDEGVYKKDKEKISKLISSLKKHGSLPTDLLQYKE